MGIICMVNSTAYVSEEFADLPPPEEVEDNVKHGITDNCPARVDEKTTAAVGNGKLLWPPTRRSLLFTANYYGAFSTIFISGMLADKLGPKRILISSLTVITFVTFLAPSLAQLNYWAYFVSRVILGMAEGFVIPCTNSMGGRWFPPNEKSAMAALYTSGNQIAAGTSAFVGSMLCQTSLFGGWPSIFYLFGTLSVLWLSLFWLVASDYPAENRWIRSEEKEYLEGRVPARKRKGQSVPWRRLLSSPALYACLFCNFTFSFCVSVTQNFLPLYFKEELFLPLSSNGLYTTIPFITQLLFKNIFASMADHSRKTGLMSPTMAVKVFQGIGSYGTAAVLISLAIFPSCHRPLLAAFLLFLYGLVFACGISGFFTSILSLAPAYTGTLSSCSMGFGQIASVIATNTVTLITYMGWPHKWLIVFCIGAALQLLSGTIFIIFGSGEPLEWAIEQDNAKISITEEELKLPEPFDEDDDFLTQEGCSFPSNLHFPLRPHSATDTFGEDREKDIDRKRKISREAALVRWTLSSGNEDVILEEEEDDHHNS